MPLAPSGVELGDDQRLLIEAAREFARDYLLPLDRQWDIDESSLTPCLPRLSEMGLLSITLPEDVGGLGGSYRTYAGILHELAYASASVAVAVSVHSMVGNILKKNAEEPQQTRWLENWGDPAHLSAFAISEAGAGSDAGATATAAVERDDGFVVTGEKMWISNGMSARWFMTLVRIKGGKNDGALTALMIDGQSEGFQRTKITGKMGIRGSDTAVIHLNELFVPRAHLLGQVGQGLKVFLSTLNEGRIGIASQATGIAEACFDEMVSYAKSREQFGQPIGKFQAIADMIADSKVELAASQELVWKAAGCVDQGDQSPSASSMAKLYASETANRIAYRAVQVHGGAGYVHECRVEQLYRDARITTIYEGTSEIQRFVIARELDEP